MLIQLFLATLMSLVTAVMHLTGLALLVRILRSRNRLVRPLKGAPRMGLAAHVEGGQNR